MIPLQQSVMEDKGVSGNKRTFPMSYVNDYFFMGKHTGYLIGYPYAHKMKDSILNGHSMPSFSEMIQEGEMKLLSKFKSDTGYDLLDDILYTDADNEQNRKKLQRYMLLVSPDSRLHPKIEYKNRYKLRNLELSDASFEFD